ncbi:hypothetical protein UF29_19980 [Vibrio parahaemolyticus]|nr:hypothetical protein UF29_19980 [Vibrio parahaemolyticus]
MCFWLVFRLSISSYLGLCKSCFGFLFDLGCLFQKPIFLLQVSPVNLSVQKCFLVLLARFLPRCLFQVVSATSALKLRLI